MIFLKFIIVILAGILGVALAVGFVFLIFYILGWTANKALTNTLKAGQKIIDDEGQYEPRKLEIESENRINQEKSKNETLQKG